MGELDLSAILWIALSVYALVSALFLVSENRAPQATLAWMLAFVFLPGLGLIVYVLFGRDTKAFSKRRSSARTPRIAGCSSSCGTTRGPCSPRATASTSSRTRRRSTRA